MLMNGTLTLNYSGHNLAQYNKYTWYNSSHGYSYVHFKTNQTLDTYIMSRVEAVGINYATGQCIRCAWVWYAYTSPQLISIGLESVYPGLTAHGVYLSSDGYVVFRGYASGLGDTTLTLNMVHANPTGYGYNLQITAVNMNNTSGNHY